MLTLTSEKKAWYLKWLCAKPQSDASQETERLEFLQEFHVPTAFRVLSEAEVWPTNAAEPEPGELLMQRWFRLFALKAKGRGEVRRVC